MPPEDTPETPAREIRVEGAGLLVLVGGALALLTGSFLIGLWVGRAFSPGARAPSGPPVADRGAEPAPDDTGGSYFDAVQGGEKSLEPQRETSPTPASSRARTASEIPALEPPAPGTYFVQVFAGRDRHAAEVVEKSITARGYRVRIDSSNDGGDTLYKVRVGGYTTQEEARSAAERLKKEGEGGAWVTQVR